MKKNPRPPPRAPQSRREPPSSESEASRAARPLREDLVLQASLEAYGFIRHEGRLSDRALDFTLRHKRNLYSNERRAVAERVYALLRRQLTVDFLLERAHRGFTRLDKTRQDVLRLAASRILHGEAPDEVARTSALTGADANGLAALPEAARALEALPGPSASPSPPRCRTSSPRASSRCSAPTPSVPPRR